MTQLKLKQQFLNNQKRRVITKFTWFPVWISNKLGVEFRWLEFVKIEQTLTLVRNYSYDGEIFEYYKWLNTKFL